MSTYFFYRCLSHDPPLQADFEISQHDDEYVQTAIDYAAGKPGWQVGEWFWNQTEHQAQVWLRQHAQCAVDVVNEYDEARPIPGRAKAAPESPENREAPPQKED